MVKRIGERFGVSNDGSILIFCDNQSSIRLV
jgi:hypothetical protein